MRRELFESFYKGNIEVIANRVVKENPEFVYKENMNGVYEEYLNQKTALKYLIKNNALSQQKKGEELLDGHKVSACITCAILKVRIIINDSINDDSEMEKYSLDKAYRLNEQVALLSGISCLLEFMADDEVFLYPNRNDTSAITPIFPKTKYEGKSNYLDSLIRALYYTNAGATVNPLLLSHIFFLLESYHRKSVECLELEQRAKTM